MSYAYETQIKYIVRLYLHLNTGHKALNENISSIL